MPEMPVGYFGHFYVKKIEKDMNFSSRNRVNLLQDKGYNK